MAKLILVHGTWHGRWTWDKVSPYLTGRGHEVIALDMPGRGNNPAPLENQTFRSYVDTVVDAIDTQEEKVHLIGHSAGGPVISQAAEERPDNVISLIYLCAFLLQNGQTIFEIASNDKGNEIVPAAEFVNDDQTSFRVPPDKAKRPFYSDCSDEDANWAIQQLVPEATEPLNTAVSLTPERYGSIPHYYIQCLQDRAISITAQRQMVAAQPPKIVKVMDSSHSPFLSQVEKLADYFNYFINDATGFVAEGNE